MTSQCDKPLALELITLNEAAYSLSCGSPTTLPPGFTELTPIRLEKNQLPRILKGDGRDIWGFTTWKGDQQYVVFRGTQDWQEWTLDAYALPMQPWDAFGSRVHRGFNEVYTGMFLNMQGWHNPIVTGHSLGAAIAALCYADCGGTLYRFASPRVGNAEFSRHLDGTWAIHNQHDLVPRLPKELGFADGGNQQQVEGSWQWNDLHVAHRLSSYREGVEKL